MPSLEIRSMFAVGVDPLSFGPTHVTQHSEQDPCALGRSLGQARWPMLGTTIHSYYLSRAERPTFPIHLRRSDIQPQLGHGHSSISGPPRQPLLSEPLHLVGRDIRYRPRPGNTSCSRCLQPRAISTSLLHISAEHARSGPAESLDSARPISLLRWRAGSASLWLPQPHPTSTFATASQ